MLWALAALAVAAATVSSDAAVREGDSPLSLEQAIARALEANPDLAAARLAVPLAREQVGLARQRPNPDLDLEESRDAPHDALTFSFPIETAGKRSRRIGTAQAGVAVNETALERTALEVRTSVRTAYYALCAAQRRLEVAQGLRGLSASARDAARQRYEAGAAPRLEVLQADLGADEAQNDVAGAAAALTAARAALNVLLAFAPDAPTTPGGDLADGDVPEPATALAVALAGSADLAALDARIAEQSARVNLARARRAPDVSFRGAATHDAPGEFDWGWRAGLSLTLPLFQSGRAEVRVEEAALAQLSAERAAAEAKLRSDVVSAATLAAARRAEYLRYRDDILPKAGELEAMAEDAYRSGQTSLVAMIQAISSIRDLRIKAIEAGLAYQEALSRLERAIGAPLP